MTSITIERMAGRGTITIPDLAAVIGAYYRAPGMATHLKPGGYDNPGDDEDPHRITRADIRAANALAAHIRSDAWRAFVDAPAAPKWLSALPDEPDALRVPPDAWTEHRTAVRDAIDALSGERPKSAGITKVLHRKRPHLVPLVDSLVREQIGAPAEPARMDVDGLMAVIDHLVAQAVRHHATLQDAIASANGPDGVRGISTLRALDIALWATHPRSTITTGLRTTIAVDPSPR